MTMKTVLLGAAAGLMTVGAAQAADLPMTKAEAVEYVKVCTEFGEGFFYIPGTDTCLRIGGEIRADYRFFDTSFDKDAGGISHNNDAYDFSTEGRMKFDARTQTEYGLLRSYFQVNIRQGNNEGAGDHSYNLSVDKAFIQLGGLTAGFAHTFFGIYDNDYGDTIFAPYFTSSSTVNLLAYTATFGGGFSATLSIEDGGEHTNQLIAPPGDGFENAGHFTTAFVGKRVPDIVGVLRVDQSWGEAAVFAAAHQTEFFDVDTVGIHTPGSEWGWAAGAGGAVKLPFLAGAHIALEGVYADGASNYVGGPGDAADYVYSFNGATDHGKGWSLTGEFGVDVSPALNVTAFGSYVSWDNGEAAQDTVFYVNGGEFKEWVAGANATYTIVKGLSVGAEVYYQSIQGKDQLADANGWFGGVRLKRVF